MVPISAPIWVNAPRPREYLGKCVGEGDQKHVADERERAFVLAERGAAQRLVGKPRDGQAQERDQRRHRGAQIHHVLVDQIEVGAEIINQHQQCEAREPGRVGFPLEPGQLVGHAGGGDQILHHVVEAAAMDLPGLALDSRGQGQVRFQAQVKVDEVERAADPGDAGNHMEPAKHDAQPFGEHDVHVRPPGAADLRPARPTWQTDTGLFKHGQRELRSGQGVRTCRHRT